MQIITITGNVGRDPEGRSTQGGDRVTSVNVAVKQGWGDRASTNWFRCSIWGKRGEAVERYVRKGAKITVVGELTIGEYQGKPQYEIRVSEIDWPASTGPDATGQRDSRQADAGNWDSRDPDPDGFDDSMPF